MLSTISSFLPSALTEKLDKLDLRGEQASHTAHTGDGEGVKPQEMAEGSKKERKKKSTSNETFIVVRPPPAKSNHPLNLQLQLVPAQHTRDRSNTSTVTTPTNSRISIDIPQRNEGNGAQPPPSPAISETETESQGNGLQRSGSSRSDRSEISAFYASGASSGSVSSFASTASTSSGRRMIIPLYNLHAHNVMTNTIHDAGTDAKVAKFLKRGIEIIDLAVLEPTEVWNDPRNQINPDIPINRRTSRNSLAPPGQSGSRAATPDHSQHSPGSSRISLSSEQSSSAPPLNTDPATSSPAAHSTGAKKIFGRIFRKREGSTGGGSGHTPTSSISSSAKPTECLAVPEVRTPTKAPAAPPRQEILLPPVLGLTPTLTSATVLPTGRCVAHVWTVRRWLKTDNQSLISGVIGKISREVSAHGHGSAPEPMGWEVRFEWVRGRSKDEKARRATRRASLHLEADRRSHTSSRRNSAILNAEKAPQQAGEQSLNESPRESLEQAGGRQQSPRRMPAGAQTTPIPSSVQSDDGSTTGDDQGEESDPEDSETPWTCSLVLAQPHHPITPVHTRGHSRTRTISSSGGLATPGQLHSREPSALPPDTMPLRLKLATLAPAPHHPKVVCQLKVVFPLPDVEVDHGVFCKRLVLQDGSTRSTVPRERPGLVMTAEEIKDVVCSTAFWVTVRQGFGGLGKVRKGDGWKIRG